MNATENSESSYSSSQLLQAFNECGWRAILGEPPPNGYECISQAFGRAARQADIDGDALQGKALGLLADLCFMVLSPQNINSPFGAPLAGSGRRSLVSDDFSDSHIDFFAEVAQQVDNPLLKGRLSDFVWHMKRPRAVEYAISAIDSYMAIPLEFDTWFADGELCWRRAISLCRMIRGAAESRLEQIESSLLHAIASSTTQDGFLTIRFADILMWNGLGRSRGTEVAAKFESLALESDTSDNFRASEALYNASANWFRATDDERRAFDMTFAQAESLVNQASATVSAESPSYAIAAYNLENAVQVYRSIPRVHRNRNDVDQRIQEIRTLLSEYRERALSEMPRSGGIGVDVGQQIEQARNAVAGNPLPDALAEFTDLHYISVEQLRQTAIANLSRSPFLASIRRSYSSPDGRTIARTAGVSRSEYFEEREEEAIHAEMTRFCYLPIVTIAVHGLILPALDVLNSEHRLPEIYLVELARRSPAVPIGREVLVGKALAAGFNRDFGTAIHLLAPQIEHIVRYQLKLEGENTTHLDQDGIETENGLSTLMQNSLTADILGEDLKYEITSVFCDQLGGNLRNDVAHGLLNDRQSYSVVSIYAWWLGLKLVFNAYWDLIGLRDVQREHDRSNEDDSVQH